MLQKMEKSDSEIIIECRKDLSAFSDLYERYSVKVFRFFAVRTGDREQSEDLTSQTFLKALEHFSSYVDNGSPFGAWLFMIAKNLLTDTFRKSSHPLPLEESEEIASEENIQENTHIHLLYEKIESLLEELEKEEKEILLLKITSELTFSEISVLLGKNENSIKSTYFRSVQKLRPKAKALLSLFLSFFLFL
jgi:RNA polymerase sigma factor (sigma-70 family)